MKKQSEMFEKNEVFNHFKAVLKQFSCYMPTNIDIKVYTKFTLLTNFAALT